MDKPNDEKQEELDVASKLQGKLLQLMKQLDKEARKLAKIVAENLNTRKKIKEIFTVIRSLTSQATTKEMWSMMRTRHLQRSKESDLEAMTEMEYAGCQVDTTGFMVAKHLQRTRNDCKEIGVQTDEFWTPEGKDRRIKEAQIREVRTY